MLKTTLLKLEGDVLELTTVIEDIGLHVERFEERRRNPAAENESFPVIKQKIVTSMFEVIHKGDEYAFKRH